MTVLPLLPPWYPPDGKGRYQRFAQWGPDEIAGHSFYHRESDQRRNR